MRKLFLAVIIVVVAAFFYRGVSEPLSTGRQKGDAALALAFEQHAGNVQVEGEGRVTKLLPDDNSGRRHQRFIVQLASGQTILIAHNIDLAPRVPSLRVGESIAFRGEYEWNPEGGVVHWTHRDPAGRHPAGWLRFGGRSFQ